MIIDLNEKIKDLEWIKQERCCLCGSKDRDGLLWDLTDPYQGNDFQKLVKFTSKNIHKHCVWVCMVCYKKTNFVEDDSEEIEWSGIDEAILKIEKKL